jgi:mRNA-degrading endonuclease RelE of RelBE toxin-antitoxin system
LKSKTTERFRKCFARLPEKVQSQTKRSFQLWQDDPRHPSINFKKIHNAKPIFSARVGLSYRTLGVKEEETIIWFWIGSHEDYNNLIKSL